MHGKIFTTGGTGSAAVWAFAAALVSGAGLVLALAVLVATVVPVATSGCDQLDGSGEPVAPAVGSVGGVGGSGITRAELGTVRASSLAGSAFTTGDFHATAYGPPWGGIQGPGVATAGGLRIDGGAPRKYFIATDPDVISLGQWVYVQPNPFGWQGAFLAADTGNAIKGRDIDFYDWRGRAYQNRWNQQVKVSDRPFPAAPGEAEGSAVGLAVNATAARDVATEITGQPVGFALVDREGRVLASVAPNATNRSASITKAMILVALTHEARSRDLTSTERQQVAAMIRRSDNPAANALFARIGPAAIDAVARRAGMTSFELVRRKQGTDGFVLGFSRVSAVDQARLFARIDELVASRHRAFALGELESIEGAGRFGVVDAAVNAVIRSKGGWRPESEGGWTVNQAAQVTIGEETYGFAVVLGKQQTFESKRELPGSPRWPLQRSQKDRASPSAIARGWRHWSPPRLENRSARSRDATSARTLGARASTGSGRRRRSCSGAHGSQRTCGGWRESRSRSATSPATTTPGPSRRGCCSRRPARDHAG